jgi:predicted phosphodiesterase
MRQLAWISIAASLLGNAAAIAQNIVVMPYIQPGNGSTLSQTDTKVICWVTDQTPGKFVVEYRVNGGPVQYATAATMKLDFPALIPTAIAPPPREVVGTKPREPKESEHDDHKEPKVTLPPEQDLHYLNHAAVLSDLPFDSEVTYSVKLSGQVIREATFRTRATADKSIRCVLVGDLAQGRPSQKAVAYNIAEQKPDFLVALGDVVYPSGRVSQYAAFYWNTYNNVSHPGPKTGAPLMATVPFYPVLGNHDIAARPPGTPDALAAYYFFHVPRNGPGEGPWATPLGTETAAVRKFRAQSWNNYPSLDAYSFDYGPAHFAIINDNGKMDITNPAFTKWLRADLLGSTAKWKFVCYHVPGFQATRQHYAEQQARQLQPLFEECGVDMTFSGHVHNYQRSVPLQFAPNGMGLVKGRVDGEFTLDLAFDGLKNTKPKGIIHIVSGGGGASLYGPAPDKVAPLLEKQYGDNFARFTAAAAVENSFVVLDLTPTRLTLRALNVDGKEIDRMVIDKSK